jgi:hypothetical protein
MELDILQATDIIVAMLHIIGNGAGKQKGIDTVDHQHVLKQHTRQKRLRRYTKFWRLKSPRLNEKFNKYIKEQYKVVDYEIRKPSMRTTDLTWRPHGYLRRIRISMARKKCLMSR